MAGINPIQAPINYKVDVQSPFEAAIGGVNLGLGLEEVRLRREAAEAAQQGQLELEELFANPRATAMDYGRLAPFLPKEQAESARKYFDMLDTKQQQSALRNAGQVYSAIKSGQTEIAKNLLKEQAVGQRNAGLEQEAKASEDSIKMIELNPTGAQTIIGLLTAGLPGGKELLENIDKVLATSRTDEKHPSDLLEAKSKASSAAIASKFAESNAVIDLVRKGWDVSKIQNDIDISRENVAIAKASANAAKETNDIKRKEADSKLLDMKLKRDQLVSDKVTTLETERFHIDNMLGTVDLILATPKDTVEWATGPFDASAVNVTFDKDTANFQEAMKTLGDQSFLAQLPAMRGFGQLSDGERKALTNSLQNLSLRQDPERLLDNVKEAKRLLLKMRKIGAMKAGMPDTIADTPRVPSTPDDIDAIVRQELGGGQ